MRWQRQLRLASLGLHCEVFKFVLMACLFGCGYLSECADEFAICKWPCVCVDCLYLGKSTYVLVASVLGIMCGNSRRGCVGVELILLRFAADPYIPWHEMSHEFAKL